MERKQNVVESAETILSPKQKIFSDSSTQTKKKYFQIPRPKQKKIFGIFPRSIQQKVDYGKETKCCGISRNNSFTQTKNIFRFLYPNKKKIFSDSSTQTKKNIWDFPPINTAESRLWKGNKMLWNQQKQFFHPNKKYFQIPLPKQKKNIFRFLDPNKKKYLGFSSDQYSRK